MNLSKYLITRKGRDVYSIHDTYTEIHIDYTALPQNIHIDTDLDIHGSGVVYSNKISGIISVSRSLWCTFNIMRPGSFINHRLLDKSRDGIYIDRLLINGYIMNNGILS